MPCQPNQIVKKTTEELIEDIKQDIVKLFTDELQYVSLRVVTEKDKPHEKTVTIKLEYA